jgi:site-specific DNA-methyltransferase (adenine-specific)
LYRIYFRQPINFLRSEVFCKYIGAIQFFQTFGFNTVFHNGTVADKVARAVGLKTATYKRAKYIIENGTEQQKQLLRSGKSEINTVYKQIQNEKTRQELIKNAKENPTLKLPDSSELLYGDFRETLKDIPDNSIDLIFADPPYKKQDLHICNDLAAFAARVLKPGRSIMLYTGGYEIPEVIDYLRNAGLKYWFYVFVKHIGGLSRLWDKKVTVDGKVLLWFVKGERPEYHEPIRNFIESTPPDKSVHDWSQSVAEAEYIISNLTVKNEVVLDPFLGSGTTAIAALKLNRKIIGTEIQEDTFNMTKNKIAEFLSSKTSNTEEDNNKILAEFIEENNLEEAIHTLLSHVNT